jgi:hypothetical protein
MQPVQPPGEGGQEESMVEGILGKRRALPIGIVAGGGRGTTFSRGGIVVVIVVVLELVNTAFPGHCDGFHTFDGPENPGISKAM